MGDGHFLSVGSIFLFTIGGGAILMGGVILFLTARQSIRRSQLKKLAENQGLQNNK